jgi:hypothetical protein
MEPGVEKVEPTAHMKVQPTGHIKTEVPPVPVKVEEPKPNAMYVASLSTKPPTLKKTWLSEGKLQCEVGILTVGRSTGFLEASFSTGPYCTEYPNLLLTKPLPKKEPKKKEPKEKAAKKRPAAAGGKKPKKKKKVAPAPPAEEVAVPAEVAVAEEEAPGEAPPDEEVPRDPPGEDADNYGVMWYRRNKCIGLRQKFAAKRQVLSFGGTRCTLTERVMRKIALEVVELLNKGGTVARAKALAVLLMSEHGYNAG